MRSRKWADSNHYAEKMYSRFSSSVILISQLIKNFAHFARKTSCNAVPAASFWIKLEKCFPLSVSQWHQVISILLEINNSPWDSRNT